MAIAYVLKGKFVMYTYQCLEGQSYAEIADCLNLAFSDYALPVQLSAEQVEAFFTSSGADLRLSYGAFYDNRLIGFMVNACSVYNGERAVFDVATGVVPEHREKKVFTNLFSFAEEELRKQGVKKYYLEVLQQNQKAINAYQKQGFAVCRAFSVLKASHRTPDSGACAITQVDLDAFDFEKAHQCVCVPPSFENSTGILMRNPASYAVAYREQENGIGAFCVFHKQRGQLMQLSFADLAQLKEILQWLFSQYPEIVIKNIDKRYPQVMELLLSLEVQEVAEQFEMVKVLGN